jgi:hypothetical protein
MPPLRVSRAATAVNALPTVIDHGSRDRAEVTLTFDSNMTTDMLNRLDSGRVRTYANLAVLDYLESHHVRATFFLAGLWVGRYPDVTRRIAANTDFEIASHSYQHLAFHAPCYGEDVLPVDQMAADVERSERQLRHYTARLTPYFRFPAAATTRPHCVRLRQPVSRSSSTTIPAVTRSEPRSPRSSPKRSIMF